MDRVEVLARACHSAWYAYTVLGFGEEGEPWDTAPEFQKKSILAAVEFWDEEMQPSPEGALVPDDWARQALPELSHNNWMKHKANDGWVYGKVKDAEAKTHPCMVAYDKLPEAQKIKDMVVLEAYLALRTLPYDVTPDPIPHMKRESWDVFCNAGMLWLANRTLHIFGWCIVLETDDEGKTVGAWPSTTDWRGFEDAANDAGYVRVAAWLKKLVTET